jgi:hypothetical protein
MECGEHDQKTTLRPRYLTGFLMMEHDITTQMKKLRLSYRKTEPVFKKLSFSNLTFLLKKKN